jgi:hypothetical protein
MTERDDDIEFDFFDDEPETEEATQRRRAIRGPRRPARESASRRPGVRPPSGFVPLVRLLGLVAFLVVGVVVLVFVIQGCRERGRDDAYRGYMDDVRVIAQGSRQVGRDLNELLTTPGIRQQQLGDGIGRLVQRAEQQVNLARELDPPAPLREQHLSMIEALQFRVIGLSRLRDGFAEAAQARPPARVGAQLADRAQRLVTSDVIWDDLFRDGAVAVLQREGVEAVDVPDSNFVVNPELVTRESMALIVQRTRGAAPGTPTGPRGTNIEAVRALPEGKTLTTGQENQITATPDLAFSVTIANGGESQEVRIPITLTIQQSPQPIRKRLVVDLIDPGEQRTVTFRNLGQIVTFEQRTTLRVNVEPVQGETRRENNTAEYPVIFTLVPS